MELVKEIDADLKRKKKFESLIKSKIFTSIN